MSHPVDSMNIHHEDIIDFLVNVMCYFIPFVLTVALAENIQTLLPWMPVMWATTISAARLSWEAVKWRMHFGDYAVQRSASPLNLDTLGWALCLTGASLAVTIALLLGITSPIRFILPGLAIGIILLVPAQVLANAQHKQEQAYADEQYRMTTVLNDDLTVHADD